MLYSICQNKSKPILFVIMKNLSKLSLLAAGAVLAALSTPATAAVVGEITFAGDATISDSQLSFANNSAIISTSFFSGGTDTAGNPLPDLGLNGPVTVSPINLAALGSTGNGVPIAPTSPLITNHIKFFPNNPGTNGLNLTTGDNRFVGGTFSGRWVANVPGVGNYSFPGEVSISAQGVPGNQSFSISGQANDPVNEIVPEPMTILGTGLALAALPRLKKAHSKKKA